MLLTFSGEASLKEESASRFWFSAANAAGELVHMSYRNRGVSRYKPTYPLLTSYIEKADRQVKFARRWAALEVWVKILGATTDLDAIENEKFYVAVSSA